MLERTAIDCTLAHDKINPGVGLHIVVNYEGSINVPLENARIVVF